MILQFSKIGPSNLPSGVAEKKIVLIFSLLLSSITKKEPWDHHLSVVEMDQVPEILEVEDMMDIVEDMEIIHQIAWKHAHDL